MASAANPLYNPSPPNIAPQSEDSRNLADWVQRELNSISKTFLDQTSLELRPIHSAPPNPREGMIVFADGTAWDPGSGKNSYEYIGNLWVPIANVGLRIGLTANKTFFVSTTGSDANDGLTAGTPWATLQKAFNYVSSILDFRGFTVTIQLADGTYTAVGDILAVNQAWLGGPLIISGNSVTPSNVVLNAAASMACVRITVPMPAAFTLQYFKFTGGSASVAVSHFGSGNITVKSPIFGAFGANSIHWQISGPGLIDNRKAENSYSIVGGAGAHISLGGACQWVFANGPTISLSGGPFAFTNSFVSVQGGAVAASNAPFSPPSGVATGKRYSAITNGIILSFGGGPNYFPGDVPGTFNTQGQYI